MYVLVSGHKYINTYIAAPLEVHAYAGIKPGTGSNRDRCLNAVSPTHHLIFQRRGESIKITHQRVQRHSLCVCTLSCMIRGHPKKLDGVLY